MGVTEPISQILEVFYKTAIQWWSWHAPALKEMETCELTLLMTKQQQQQQQQNCIQSKENTISPGLGSSDNIEQDSLSLAV